MIRQQGNTRCIKTALVTNVASEPQFKKNVSVVAHKVEMVVNLTVME